MGGEIRVAYYGYHQDPPFRACPAREIWLRLVPLGQTVYAATKDVLDELISKSASVPIPVYSWEAIRGIGDAVRREFALICRRDPGSWKVHWFLVRW